MSFDDSNLVSIIGNSINNGSSNYDNIECVLTEDFKISNVKDDFFSLPIEYILSIIKKACKTSDKNIFASIKDIISKMSKIRNDTPLILNACDFPEATADECIEIISRLKCSPLCKRLGKVYKTSNKPSDFEENIFQAIKNGKKDSVEYIISHNPLMTTKLDEYKRIPLHYAYIYKRDDIKDIFVFSLYFSH